MLAYVVLTGVLPFVGKDRADLFARIQRGQYTYPDRPTGGAAGGAQAASAGAAAGGAAAGGESGAEPVSDLAKDLISRLLKLEPMERYSTRELLQHPWLCERTSGDSTPADLTDVDHLDTVHEMLRKFNAERRLRRAMHVVIACVRFRRAGEGWLRDSSEIEGEAADQREQEEGPPSAEESAGSDNLGDAEDDEEEDEEEEEEEEEEGASRD